MTVLSLDLAPLASTSFDFGVPRYSDMISKSLLLARPRSALSSTLTSKVLSSIFTTLARMAFGTTRTLNTPPGP